MSEVNLRIQVDGALQDVGKVYEKVEKLRLSASGTGKEIEKELQLAAKGMDYLRYRTLGANKEIRELQKKQQELKGALQRNNISTTNQSKALEQAAQATGRKAKAIQGLTEKYYRHRNALGILRNAKRDYANQADSLRQRIIQLNRAKKDGTAQTNRLSGSMGGLSQAARRVAGVFGMGLGLVGVVRLLRGVTRTIQTFELAQKQLEAVTGATSRQMEGFAREAIRVGSASIFGAEGVTKLQVQLAKMGFTIPQINDMAESITNLAMATQEELPKAAETVAFVIRAYQMDSRETINVTDTMARSFTASALDLEKFRQSMKYIAPIANQANFTLEETTAILGKLADAGISGSLAGTSMRNIIFQLSDSTSELTQRTGVAIKGFDDFTEAIWKLNEAGTDLEDVFNIMDRRAASAFTLMIESVGSLEEFRDVLQDAGGAAEEMSRVQLESLTYQTKLARRAWEGFVLSLDKGEGTLSRTLKSVLGTFTDTLQGWTRNLNKMSRATERDIMGLESLVGLINNTNLSFDQRLKYLRRIQSEYPGYFKHIQEDIENNSDLASAISSVNRQYGYWRKNMEGRLEIELASEATEELKREIEDLNKEISDGIEMMSRMERNRRTLLTVFGKEIFVHPGHAWWESPVTEEQVKKMINELNELEDELVEMEEKERKITENVLSTLPIDEFIGHYKRHGHQPWVDMIEETKEKFDDIFDINTGNIQDVENAAIPILENLKEQIKAQEAIIAIERRRAQATGGPAGGQLIPTDKWREAELALQGYLKAEEGLYEYIQQIIQGFEDEEKQNAQRINNEKKLRELQAERMYDGIELEKELAKIQKWAAHELADLKSKEEADRLKILANLEDAISKQERLSSLHQRNARDRQREYQNAQALLGLEREIADEKIKAAEFDLTKHDVEQRYDLERKAADEHFSRLKKDVTAQAEHDKEQAKLAFEAATELMDEETEEYKRHLYIRNEAYKQIEAEKNAEMEKISKQGRSRQIELNSQELQEVINVEQAKTEERIRGFEHQQELDRIAFDSERRTASERRDFQRKQEEERAKMLAEEYEAQMLLLEVERQRVTDGKAGDATAETIRQLEERIAELRRLMGIAQAEVESPSFDQGEWDALRDAAVGAMNDIGNALTKLSSDKADYYRKEREMLDRLVDESDSALERELQLREQGFASDVEAARKHHEEMKRLRRQALEDEERAAERQRRTEAIVQSTMLATSAVQIIKDATRYRGLIGVATAAGAIASMFALWSNVKQQSSAAAMYKEGGSFVLGGDRHSGGGTMLAPGHEAEKGEMVGVFKRSVTKKHGPQIKSLVDAVNAGNMPQGGSVNVFADNKDLRAMRRMMEKEEKVYYQGNKKIVKRGNFTTICHLN